MALPVMDSDLVSREYLRIGGGYGASALGQSPAGGLDIDNGGNLATNGDVTVEGKLLAEGDLSVEGMFENWSCWIPANEMWPTGSGGGGVTGPTRTIWGWGRETQTYDFAPALQQKLCFSFALPCGYDGRSLAYSFVWTADDGTAGDVCWGILALGLGDGSALTTNFASGSTCTVTDSFQGTSTLHVATLYHTPSHVPVYGDLVVGHLFRSGTDALDTFDGTARLIGVKVGLV